MIETTMYKDLINVELILYTTFYILDNFANLELSNLYFNLKNYCDLMNESVFCIGFV